MTDFFITRKQSLIALLEIIHFSVAKFYHSLFLLPSFLLLFFLCFFSVVGDSDIERKEGTSAGNHYFSLTQWYWCGCLFS